MVVDPKKSASAVPARDLQTRVIGVGVVVDWAVESGRVLISQRRADTVLGGLWEFPGGKLEAGESVEACVCRELREELGVEVVVVGELGALEHTYPHGRIRLEPRLCRLVSGEPRALEVAQWRWVGADELDRYAFPPANAPLIPEVIAAVERLRP